MATEQLITESDGSADTTLETDFIIDGVLHAYNHRDDNAYGEAGLQVLSNAYGAMRLTGDDEFISRESYMRDWSAEELMSIVFKESDVSVGVYHALPWFDWFRDGMVSNQKGASLRKHWPNRVLFYGAINPLKGAQSVAEVEYLIEECGANGIKLYPENYRVAERSIEPVLLGDPSIGPVLERIMEYGVPVAIHKAMPTGQGLTDNYRVGDVEEAAMRYPDLQIEVVHSGMAFIDETSLLMSRYKNVWANLEVTTAYAVKAQRRFAFALGGLLRSGAADRIIWASGTVLIHPQTAIDAFRAFEMPPDIAEGYAFPELTAEIKRGILGLNCARLHNLDVASLQRALGEDDFARSRRTHGIQPRWSTVI